MTAYTVEFENGAKKTQENGTPTSEVIISWINKNNERLNL